MKFFIAFAVLFVCVVARPGDKEAQVVQQTQEINPDGSWTNNLQVDNGIAQSQSGSLKTVPGAEAPSVAVTGEYTQIGENGEQLRVTYIADENGFQPQGAHLPKNPEA